jgi:hypothetical protein
LIVYLKKYQEGGKEALKKLGYQGQGSQLNQHNITIEEYFQKNPPRTATEANAMIEKLRPNKKKSKPSKRIYEKDRDANSQIRVCFRESDKS